MHNYTRQIFDTLTKKEKRAFIDRMIDSTLDLDEKEIQIATKEQRRRYFDLKFHTRRIINPHELKFLDFDQILHFLQKNNNMIEHLWQDWDGSTWVNNWKDRYVYDGNNNRIEYMTHYWSGSNWETYYKYLYNYDENNNN